MARHGGRHLSGLAVQVCWAPGVLRVCCAVGMTPVLQALEDSCLVFGGMVGVEPRRALLSQ